MPTYNADMLRAAASGTNKAAEIFNALQDPMYQAASNGEYEYAFPETPNDAVKAQLVTLLTAQGLGVDAERTTISWEIIS